MLSEKKISKNTVQVFRKKYQNSTKYNETDRAEEKLSTCLKNNLALPTVRKTTLLNQTGKNSASFMLNFFSNTIFHA